MQEQGLSIFQQHQKIYFGNFSSTAVPKKCIHLRFTYAELLFPANIRRSSPRREARQWLGLERTAPSGRQDSPSGFNVKCLWICSFFYPSLLSARQPWWLWENHQTLRQKTKNNSVYKIIRLLDVRTIDNQFITNC